MNTQSDFEDFFRLLESNRVEYMVVGGYAVAFHGYPRFTKDIDVFFAATEANAARLRDALVSRALMDRRCFSGTLAMSWSRRFETTYHIPTTGPRKSPQARDVFVRV